MAPPPPTPPRSQPAQPPHPPPADGFLEGALGDLDQDAVAEAASHKRRRTAQRRQARARPSRARAGGRKGSMRKLQDIALFAGDAIAEAEKATVKRESAPGFDDDDAFDGAGEDALAADDPAPTGGALATPAPVPKQKPNTASAKARARAEAKAALFASASSAPVKTETAHKSAAVAARRSMQQAGATAPATPAPAAVPAAPAPGGDVGHASAGGLYAAVRGSGEAMSVLGDATGGAGAMLEPSRDEQGRYVDAFWFDAYEEPRAPGTVFLFCKVRDPNSQGQWRSLCVVVPHLERELYFLPRRVVDEKTGEEKPVPTLEVYAEVKEILRKHCGSGRSEFGAKPVKLNYAFEEPGVPREPTDYLKVVLSPTAKPLDPRLSGRTFSRVFGTHAPCLENFMLERDLMGPCWLRIRDPQVQPTALSWCAYEVKVAGAGSLVKMDQGPDASPPLRTMSFSLKTVVNPRTQAHEVVVASLLLHEAVEADGPTQRKTPSQHMTLMRPLNNGNASVMRLSLPDLLKRNRSLSVRACANEQELLVQLLHAVHASDPDVLVGHNMLGFDMDVLLNRMRTLHVSHWSKIGRLRRREMPRAVAGAGGKDSFVGVLTCGRLLCDTYLAARELVRQTIYTLSALAKELLGHARMEIDPAQVPSFTSDAASLVKLAQHTENDAFLSLQLMFKLEVMPLTKQITNLAGNLWARTLKVCARPSPSQYRARPRLTRAVRRAPARSGSSTCCCTSSSAWATCCRTSCPSGSSRRAKTARGEARARRARRGASPRTRAASCWSPSAASTTPPSSCWTSTPSTPPSSRSTTSASPPWTASCGALTGPRRSRAGRRAPLRQRPATARRRGWSPTWKR